VRASAAVLIAALAFGGVVLWQTKRAPVKIVRAYHVAGSSRVTLDIRNDMPNRVRLNNIDLWTRIGTNWAFVGSVALGYTNCGQRSLSIDVDFPAAEPGPWKATLVYMPAFSRLKLLGWRLRDTWKTRSFHTGFMTTGWEGSRRTDSAEIAP
jgi:hypothetical protein